VNAIPKKASGGAKVKKKMGRDGPVVVDDRFGASRLLLNEPDGDRRGGQRRAITTNLREICEPLSRTHPCHAALLHNFSPSSLIGSLHLFVWTL
jgi:hypothetical protein